MLASYSSIFNLGHVETADLFAEPVIVQEKVDGSQFSFGVVMTDSGAELFARSKGANIIIGEPEKMFSKAVATVLKLFQAGKLTPGWTYRGEYLSTPAHNTLNYSRVPVDHIILYDIDMGEQNYINPGSPMFLLTANTLDLEVVPVLFNGEVRDITALQAFLDRESVLGGVKLEGVVIKNYNRFARDKKQLMGKLVRPEFKEQNRVAWKVTNPTSGDVIQNIIDTYRVNARWDKAIQHLRDDGKLTDNPRDIALIMKEIPADVLKECEEEIKAALWKWAWPKISRGISAGAPEYYKAKLMERQTFSE